MLLAARLQNDETGTIRSVMKRAIITTQFESSSAMKLLHHIAKHKCTSQAYRSSHCLMTESMTTESKEDTTRPTRARRHQLEKWEYETGGGQVRI
jgi:hypothetical protein